MSPSAPSNIVSETKKLISVRVRQKTKKKCNKVDVIVKNNVDIKNHKKPYSQLHPCKTQYTNQLQMGNSSMFLPHDEFETVSEYKTRVSGQVELMKEIVQMTTQKYEIKKVSRLKKCKRKRIKKKSNYRDVDERVIIAS